MTNKIVTPFDEQNTEDYKLGDLQNLTDLYITLEDFQCYTFMNNDKKTEERGNFRFRFQTKPTDLTNFRKLPVITEITPPLRYVSPMLLAYLPISYYDLLKPFVIFCFYQNFDEFDGHLLFVYHLPFIITNC